MIEGTGYTHEGETMIEREAMFFRHRHVCMPRPPRARPRGRHEMSISRLKLRAPACLPACQAWPVE